MNPMAAAMVGVAYLLGSLSFAVLLVRLSTGKDIRAEGSGNAGATNVLRAHGKKLGLAVAALDIGKGALAVFLLRQVTADPRYAAAAAFAAVLGHVFPIFYGFRGGKGVATAVGAFLMLAAAPDARLHRDLHRRSWRRPATSRSGRWSRWSCCLRSPALSSTSRARRWWRPRRRPR